MTDMNSELKREAWGWLRHTQTVFLATWDGKRPRVRPVRGRRCQMPTPTPIVYIQSWFSSSPDMCLRTPKFAPSTAKAPDSSRPM